MSINPKLEAIGKEIGAEFTLRGQSIALSEIFADNGLLPGLTRRADQLCSLCFGYGLGATYDNDEKAVLGNVVKFDDFTPEVLRLLCIIDSLYEIIRANPQGQPVPLDELMYD